MSNIYYVDMYDSQDSNDNSEIYARLDSFEEKLDSKLQDLESLGMHRWGARIPQCRARRSQ